MIECAGNIRKAREGEVLAALAWLLMLWAGSGFSTAVGLFGLTLGVCMNSCLTLLKAWNGGDLFPA